jgi:hypothetical protein
MPSNIQPAAWPTHPDRATSGQQSGPIDLSTSQRSTDRLIPSLAAARGQVITVATTLGR